MINTKYIYYLNDIEEKKTNNIQTSTTKTEIKNKQTKTKHRKQKQKKRQDKKMCKWLNISTLLFGP
jgi:hypothetical protein